MNTLSNFGVHNLAGMAQNIALKKAARGLPRAVICNRLQFQLEEAKAKGDKKNRNRLPTQGLATRTIYKHGSWQEMELAFDVFLSLQPEWNAYIFQLWNKLEQEACYENIQGMMQDMSRNKKNKKGKVLQIEASTPCDIIVVLPSAGIPAVPEPEPEPEQMSSIMDLLKNICNNGFLLPQKPPSSVPEPVNSGMKCFGKIGGERMSTAPFPAATWSSMYDSIGNNILPTKATDPWSDMNLFEDFGCDTQRETAGRDPWSGMNLFGEVRESEQLKPKETLPWSDMKLMENNIDTASVSVDSTWGVPMGFCFQPGMPNTHFATYKFL
jgi:hypothetical protein